MRNKGSTVLAVPIVWVITIFIFIFFIIMSVRIIEPFLIYQKMSETALKYIFVMEEYGCINKAEKEAYMNIYIEDKQLFIEISNSFNGIIDFEKLNESGYTTKSDGHGYGLALAREIIKNNNKLESETEVNGNIFTQRLKIKM